VVVTFSQYNVDGGTYYKCKLKMVRYHLQMSLQDSSLFLILSFGKWSELKGRKGKAGDKVIEFLKSSKFLQIHFLRLGKDNFYFPNLAIGFN